MEQKREEYQARHYMQIMFKWTWLFHCIPAVTIAHFGSSFCPVHFGSNLAALTHEDSGNVPTEGWNFRPLRSTPTCHQEPVAIIPSAFCLPWSDFFAVMFFFVCDESEFLNMVPVCLQRFSFKNATKNRLFTTIRFDTFSFVCLIVTLSELGGWKTFARRLQKTAWCREPFVFLGVGYSLYVDSKEGRANHTPKHTSQWTQMSRSCLLQE